MKRLLFILLIVLTAVSMAQDRQPPQNPGSALIIYNIARSCPSHQSAFDFSYFSMRIFMASLDPIGRGNYLNVIDHSVDFIPPINPPMTRVTAISIDRTAGISSYLRRWADNNLFGREREIFDELHRQGNPLSFWSQVYDLRHIHGYDTACDPSFPITQAVSAITTAGERSDLAYFRAFLRDGGSLLILGSNPSRAARHNSIISVVRDVTRNTSLTTASGQHPVFGMNFWFNNSPEAEYFATDWNNLTDLQMQFPMGWTAVTSVQQSNLQHAIPIITNGGSTGNAVMMFWNSDGMMPEFNNGRLIIGFNITAFADHRNVAFDGTPTTVTTATAAMIQNLYALNSKTTRYNISKTFVETERRVGETGRVRIAIRNPNNHPLNVGAISDNLSECLRFVRDIRHYFIDHLTGDEETTSATVTRNGQRISWVLNDNYIPMQSDWIIEFEFAVNNIDCEG